MASPQLEKGHTRIANEILEASSKHVFNGSQYAIILIIWRMTYGWKGRKSSGFSTSYLSEATGLTANTVAKELRFLIENKVLTVVKEATNKEARQLSFNKNYEKWEVERRGKIVQTELFDYADQDSLEYANRDTQTHEIQILGYANRDTNKERSTKELKESIKDIIYSRFDEFWKFYPKKVGKAAATKHFTRLYKDKSFSWDDFIRGTKAYVEHCQRSNRFLKDGSSFVNQETYKDFLGELPIDTSIPNSKQNYASKTEKKSEILDNIYWSEEDEQKGSRGSNEINHQLLPKF